MTNELCGNMDASKYKNYILAFMFYRYLSEHQEAYIREYELFEEEEPIDINQVLAADLEKDN